MSDITVLYYPDDITLLYSLSPLYRHRQRRRFLFTADLSYVLQRDRRPNLLVVRFMKRPEALDPLPLFKELRQKYRRLVYFDDTADPRELKAELLPLVDAYYKKQLLKDRSLYLKSVYGKRLYTDYYHRMHSVRDDNETILAPVDAGQLKKLRTSWNLGLGSYPKSRIRKGLALRLEPFFGPGALGPLLADPRAHRSGRATLPKVSARFGIRFDRRTVSYHRQLFLQAAERRKDLFLTGKVSLARFNRELREVQAVLSPFGWGEICFRDFEAVMNCAALIKPCMDHIETWPDIYLADRTYVSVDWDARDLVEKTEAILGDEERRLEMTSRTLELFHNAYRHQGGRVDSLIEEFDN